MRFSATFSAIAALLVGFAAAQNNSVTVQVGASSGNALQFIPPTVTATNGTVVTFMFSGVPGNHSVTQSTFQSPCTPMSNGFDSGWVFRSGGDSPTWNLTITDDSKPIWFFCKALVPGPHCSMYGMVGAINAPSSGSNTFANFQTAARGTGVTPSQVGGGNLVGPGASASAPPGPIGSGASLAGAPTGTGAGGTSESGATNTATAPTNSSSGAGGNNAGFVAVPFGSILSSAALAVAFLI